MDLRRRLAAFAAHAPVPTFAVAGLGMRAAVQDLRLEPGVHIVDSPRAALILLVAGDVPPSHAAALALIHDGLPHPRATIRWGTADGAAPPNRTVAYGTDPVPTLRALATDLLAGTAESEPPLTDETGAVPWEGIGPYRQGGTGMTGGAPYGRPMAELGPDRDGLRLDVLPVRIGPFFPRLPAGLELQAKLAGDVVTEAAVVPVTWPARLSPPAGNPSASPFIRALSRPVSIAELELARARDHLRWLAEALIAQGLPALGRRALRLARDVRPGGGDRIRSLATLLDRTGLYRWSIPAAGAIDARLLAGAGLGPIARAAGIPEDVRTEDASYRALGFVPLTIDRNDAIGRWRVRIEETVRSLDLAARAGDLMTSVVGRVESPRGRLTSGDSPTERAMAVVPELLAGLGWGDAIAALVSLDLDLEEAATTASQAAEAAA